MTLCIETTGPASMPASSTNSRIASVSSSSPTLPPDHTASLSSSICLLLCHFMGNHKTFLNYLYRHRWKSTKILGMVVLICCFTVRNMFWYPSGSWRNITSSSSTTKRFLQPPDGQNLTSHYHLRPLVSRISPSIPVTDDEDETIATMDVIDSEEEEPEDQVITMGVVVAHCKEDLRYLDDFGCASREDEKYRYNHRHRRRRRRYHQLHYYIMSKCGRPIPKFFNISSCVTIHASLPNCGVQEYAYFTFVEQYYDNLPSMVAFIQGGALTENPHLFHDMLNYIPGTYYADLSRVVQNAWVGLIWNEEEANASAAVAANTTGNATITITKSDHNDTSTAAIVVADLNTTTIANASTSNNNNQTKVAKFRNKEAYLKLINTMAPRLLEEKYWWANWRAQFLVSRDALQRFSQNFYHDFNNRSCTPGACPTLDCGMEVMYSPMFGCSDVWFQPHSPDCHHHRQTQQQEVHHLSAKVALQDFYKDGVNEVNDPMAWSTNQTTCGNRTMLLSASYLNGRLICVERNRTQSIQWWRNAIYEAFAEQHSPRLNDEYLSWRFEKKSELLELKVPDWENHKANSQNNDNNVSAS